MSKLRDRPLPDSLGRAGVLTDGGTFYIFFCTNDRRLYKSERVIVDDEEDIKLVLGTEVKIGVDF